MAEQVTDLLRQVEVFGRLPEQQLRAIGKILRERRVAQNHVLFRQGEASDALYVIVDGRVRISIRSTSGEERVLAFVGAGDVVGEMGLLSGERRSATATASTNLVLLQLRNADFDALLANNIELMRELARVVARRRDSTRQRLLESADGGQAGRNGVLSVLFSPRGGAGNTMLATNLAVALAHRAPDRVVLVDLNVMFAHVPLMLNIAPRTSLAAISSASLRQMDHESFQFYLTTHAESSLRVLSSVLRPEEGELVTADHVRSALGLLRRQFQYVVVDLPRSFSELNLTAIESAANVLILCVPDRVGVRSVTETQRIVRELLRLRGDPLQYVVNHTSPAHELADDALSEALNVRFVASIPFGGDAPSRAALEGQPIVTRFPNSAVTRTIQSLAGRLEQQLREAQALQVQMSAPVLSTSRV